ncbi:hypothetical protein VPH35_096821 [Triticum aestivum]|uniref:Uncharacterized protein n=1 Tax=Triticum aestivum TaxID=4565 RepID=A0A3B6MMJ4_WHEAT
MDDAIDLDAAGGLASLASSSAAATKTKKPRAPRKTAAATKPKKPLTPEQRARESAKRKDRRHAADARDEAAAQAAVAAVQQEFTNARVAAATREALYMLGVNPSQRSLVQAAVAVASTGSSAFPRMVLPDSPRASVCNPIPGFHVYPQASRLSGECSPDVSVVAPSTPAPAPIDLNATPVVGGSSSGGLRKRARQTPDDGLPDARNLFEEMPSAVDEDYMRNLIFEGGVPGAGYDPDETQSQDGRGAFTPAAGYDPDQAAFMRDQVGIDLDGFPLDHEFPGDYGLEEEDECDIEVEPLFEDELANQAAGPKPKRKSKRMKAYTAAEDKLLCECWRDIGQDPKTGAEQKHSTFGLVSTESFMSARSISSFGGIQGSTQWQVLQPLPLLSGHQGRGEVQGTKCRTQGTWGKKAVEDVGEGEPARPRGKTNSKKEDKRDAATNALIASVDGMMNKKDSREEERRRFKAEQMDAFMEIQRRRLDLDAEKQTKMFELEAEKQAKMLEIEAANAKTKAKEVALASMMTGVEIMKADLNSVSPRKRPWFEKMQANILKFNDE